jgi:ribonuclease T1
MQPLAILAAVIAVVVTTWMQRGDAPRASNPAPTAQTKTVAPPTSNPIPTAQRETAAPRYNLDQVPEAEREQLRQTLRLIDAGGPFPYPRKDGTVFGNRENRLPRQPRGFYREYTVLTPGASNRGARRVVQGKGGETYYTNDHYASFIRLDE